MKFLNMLSMKISTSLLIVFFMLLQGCVKETEEDIDYIARVDDKYLSASEIDKELDSLRSFSKFREEYIREWIDRELLYNMAVEKGIPETKEYNDIRKVSEKELAISFLIKRKSSDLYNYVSDDELRKFYDASAEFSTLEDDLYILNNISFNDPYAAERFRKNLIDSDTNWISTIREFDSSAISDYSLNAQFLEHQLEPKHIPKRLQRMTEKEVSSVFEKEPKVFSIVQLVDRFEKGSRIPFKYIKEDINTLYIAYRQKELLNSLLDSLYKEFDIEIKSE